jgi:transcriptional regulator with XRE-family HTH domain
MANTDRKAREIAGRARLARENAGLSQGQAAKKLGIARSSLTEAEGGNRKISASELSQMATIYGVSAAWLACAEDEAADPDRDRIELAARELARLKRDDLETVLQLVRSIRAKGRSAR